MIAVPTYHDHDSPMGSDALDSIDDAWVSFLHLTIYLTHLIKAVSEMGILVLSMIIQTVHLISVGLRMTLLLVASQTGPNFKSCLKVLRTWSL